MPDTQRELPYDFDLLFDIKTVSHLHDVLKYGLYNTIYSIEELMIEHGIPFPEWHVATPSLHFPKIVWIDRQGGYQTYKPLPEEEHRFQCMKKF